MKYINKLKKIKDEVKRQTVCHHLYIKEHRRDAKEPGERDFRELARTTVIIFPVDSRTTTPISIQSC